MDKILATIALTCIMAISLAAPAPADAAARHSAHHVVLLHGIARSSDHMEGLEKHLSNNGYEVINLDYPSTEHTLQELVEIIDQQLKAKLPGDAAVSFVGYSMGGLLVRAYINNHRPINLQRVILLASPNKGSEVADLLKDTWLYREFFGPAGQQLTTSGSGLDTLLGKVDYELGVVAGNSTIDPISSAIIPGEDDGKVSVNSTKVIGMKEHIVVEAPHTFFPENPRVQQLTLNFLENGTFDRSP